MKAMPIQREELNAQGLRVLVQDGKRVTQSCMEDRLGRTLSTLENYT